jgi:NAD(P)-dependent dehydrogenase (short-subunit alcohol dehydrogenase family)
MAADFSGKTALVTGGSGGLGRATCRALAAAGATVIVADIDTTAGPAVAQEVGGHFVATDVRSLEANEAMVAFALEQSGRLDYVHLNAGIATGCGIGEWFDLERYRTAMAINLDGVVFGCQAALAAVREAGGAFVATASLAGLTATAYDPFYAANKHAVVGLARSLGPALAEQGVRFNAVCPGFAESNIIKDIREGIVANGIPIIPAETVADTVVHLFASPEINGECWFIQAGREPDAFQFRRVPGHRGTPQEASA